MTTTFDLTTIERSAVERRRFRRVRATLPVRWSDPHAEAPTWIDADTLDVGAGGMRVRSAVPEGVDEGAQVCVALELAERQVVLVAELRGVRGPVGEDGCREVAFHFVAIERNALRALVRALLDFDPV